MPRLAGLAFIDVEQEDSLDERVRARPVPINPNVAKRVDATRITGSVRKLKQDRGFGFIAGDDGQDHFFHWSGMEKTSKNFRDLEIQDRVSFISLDGDKGPRAILVRVLVE